MVWEDNAWVVVVTENECFFQSSIDKWIGDCKEYFQGPAKVQVSRSILQ